MPESVAEHDDLVVADDLGRRRQLPAAHRRQVGADLRAVHRGVEDVAGLAAGAAHEHGPHAARVVAGDRARALRGLVVGVRVDREQTAVSHASEPTGGPEVPAHAPCGA
jgi:hypothetical protein